MTRRNLRRRLATTVALATLAAPSVLEAEGVPVVRVKADAPDRGRELELHMEPGSWRPLEESTRPLWIPGEVVEFQVSEHAEEVEALLMGDTPRRYMAAPLETELELTHLGPSHFNVGDRCNIQLPNGLVMRDATLVSLEITARARGLVEERQTWRGREHLQQVDPDPPPRSNVVSGRHGVITLGGEEVLELDGWTYGPDQEELVASLAATSEAAARAAASIRGLGAAMSNTFDTMARELSVVSYQSTRHGLVATDHRGRPTLKRLGGA